MVLVLSTSLFDFIPGSQTDVPLGFFSDAAKTVPFLLLVGPVIGALSKETIDLGVEVLGADEEDLHPAQKPEHTKNDAQKDESHQHRSVAAKFIRATCCWCESITKVLATREFLVGIFFCQVVPSLVSMNLIQDFAWENFSWEKKDLQHGGEHLLGLAALVLSKDLVGMVLGPYCKSNCVKTKKALQAICRECFRGSQHPRKSKDSKRISLLSSRGEEEDSE